MPRTLLRLAIYLGCIMIFCTGACTAAPDQQSVPGDVINYANKVIAIDRLAGQIIATEGLLYDESFIRLAKEGTANIDACVQFLADQGRTSQQKMIAILSMHSLGVREYVLFLHKLADLFDKGLVTSNDLGSAVVPANAFSTVLIENYNESDVRSLLMGIAERKGIRPATKSAIESILSGKALEDWISFRRYCCAPGGK